MSGGGRSDATVLLLDEKQSLGSDHDDLDHLYCETNHDLALCGRDLSDVPYVPDDEELVDLCVVCDDLMNAYVCVVCRKAH